MRVAIVGNGPTARKRREQVNACDVVVRLNVPNMEPGDKFDVWASNYNAELAEKLKGVNLPTTKWLCAPTVYHKALATSGLLEHAAERQVVAEQWAQLFYAANFHRPTTGFAAVLLALEAGATELFLAGFDATTKDKDGWGSAAWDWKNERLRWSMHDFAAEKRALFELARTGEFCGKRYEVRVEWPDAPDGQREGTDMGWVLCAYHTGDELYTRCADILRESCRRFDVPCDIQRTDLAPGWAAGCRHKPEFVREMLRKHYGTSVVYFDVDAELQSPPYQFPRLESKGVDFGARWRDGEMLASAFYIRNSSYMRDLVDQWAREVADLDKDVPFRLQEQQALQRLIERAEQKGSIRVERLPAEYCVLYGLPGEPERPVILQKQASRKALGDKHVPVHPALAEVG